MRRYAELSDVFVASVGKVAVGFTYVWHERPVPSGLAVRQVYGYLLCPRTARVLIRDVPPFHDLS
jgi:hypothetical protein